MDEKLKACPFCGSADHLFIEPDETGSGGQWVSPIHAGCSQLTGCGVSRTGDDTAEAISAWNTRPTQERRKALEEAAFEKAAQVADYAVERAERDWRDPAKQEAVKQVGEEIAEAIRAYKPGGAFATLTGTEEADGERERRLRWHIPENLRWLAEQDHRPDRVPCGDLTGQFLRHVAERFEELAALTNKDNPHG